MIDGVEGEETGWKRASFCDNSSGNCVEVKVMPESRAVAVRDSKDPGAILLYTAKEWQAFTAGVRAGEFDE